MSNLDNIKLKFKESSFQRVCSNASGAQEIFDIYHLGLFAAPHSFLSNLTRKPIETDSITFEKLELVELQPEAYYQPHFHKKSAAIIYIFSGIGTFILGNQYIAYDTYQRIIIPMGMMHGFKTQTRTLFLSIQSPPIIDSDTQQIDLYYEADNHEK